MIRTSYLRAYQPLDSFDPDEGERWVSGQADAQEGHLEVTRRWLVSRALPDRAVHEEAEGAFIRRVENRVLVCPWRLRLRMLAGLLAFRDSMPEEVAEAFVPEAEARRAAGELAHLGESKPDLKSHILHANWHVPLRWFSAFDDSERILTEDSSGLRIRYETSIGDARVRLEAAIDVLERSWMDDGVVDAVKELLAWLALFPDDGLLELDYATVASMFDADELVEDRSAADVTSCLEALRGGDFIRAGKVFSLLTERWAALRARESAN